MKKAVTWESQIDGKDYVFSYHVFKREHILTINNISNEFPVKFMDFLGVDLPFVLDEKEVRLVIDNYKPDIAIDGVYLRSGKQYIKRPAWAWLFLALCLLLPVINIGGALPVIFGFFGAVCCVRASKASLSVATRLLICTLITLSAWALWFLSAIAVGLIIGIYENISR